MSMSTVPVKLISWFGVACLVAFGVLGFCATSVVVFGVPLIGPFPLRTRGALGPAASAAFVWHL